MALFSRQTVLAQTAYSGLKRRAQEQAELLVGTPGSVDVRTVNGSEFYYRQFYDAEGKKAAEYIGPVGQAAAEDRARVVKERIVEGKDILLESQQVRRLGYLQTDARAAAILAALANRQLFRAGAVLVGTHAYTALLNDLGVRADSYLTEDVDIARGEPLDVALSDDEDFGKILASSRIELHPVPGFGRRSQSTSFKAKGASRLRVDLLVPARGAEVATRPVPELRAHAAALPHLGYLLAEPIDAVAIGKNAVVPVRVPRPERMAWHKMLVSELRGVTREKRTKDMQQAAVLTAVLSEEAADVLADAWSDVPRSLRSAMRRGAENVLKLLAAARHERAIEELASAVGIQIKN